MRCARGARHVVTVVCVLGLLGWAAPAGAFTKKPLVFDVMVGPKGDTPCTIQADLYTPDGASADHPVPAILATHGFGGSKADNAPTAATYVAHGYAFLSYSGLGFGGSSCKITWDDPDWDGRAGSQLISFLGGSKAARDGTRIDYVVHDGPDDPRVGMLGGSYAGAAQFAVASVDPRLDTIIPDSTWNDLSYSFAPNNADNAGDGVTSETPGGFKLDWPAFFTATGSAGGVGEAAGDQDTSRLGPCPGNADGLCAAVAESAATGYPSDDALALLRHASVTSYVSKIRIPTFLIQGQSDNLFYTNEAAATYRSLRAQGTPVRMLWKSGGHTGGGDVPELYMEALRLGWMDYYLRGVGGPRALGFMFLRDWVPYQGKIDAADSVGVTPSYPAAGDTPFYLSGADQLTTRLSSVRPGTASFAAGPSPGGTGGGAVGSPEENSPPAPDAPGTFAGYETATLTEDVDVAGIPTLRMKLDAPTFAASQQQGPAGKLVLFAKLLDVDPSGSARLIRNRLAAARVADVTKPVEIQLPGIVHRFAKGHRIRLVVATSNATSRGNAVAGPVSLVTDPAAPSALSMPVLHGPVRSLTDADPAPAPAAPRKACRSRRVLTIRVGRSARVKVNGKRVRVRRGRVRIDLRGTRKQSVVVQIVRRTRNGKIQRVTRRYRTCVG